jgi:hypothetical protein
VTLAITGIQTITAPLHGAANRTGSTSRRHRDLRPTLLTGPLPAAGGSGCRTAPRSVAGLVGTMPRVVRSSHARGGEQESPTGLLRQWSGRLKHATWRSPSRSDAMILLPGESMSERNGRTWVGVHPMPCRGARNLKNAWFMGTSRQQQLRHAIFACPSCGDAARRYADTEQILLILPKRPAPFLPKPVTERIDAPSPGSVPCRRRRNEDNGTDPTRDRDCASAGVADGR